MRPMLMRRAWHQLSSHLGYLSAYCLIQPLPHEYCASYTNKSHSTSVAQNTLVAQNTFCAVLPRSVARFSSLLPLPTFSCVLSESSTSWSMCAACMLRLLASVDCSSEISVSDFSVALPGR